MAIDPNILLVNTVPDINQALLKGVQTAQSIQGMQQAAALQPYRQQLLQAQVSALPMELEQQKLANQQAVLKMRVQGAAIAANQAYKYMVNNDLEGLKKFASTTPLLMSDDRDELLKKIDAGDVNGILNDILTARNAGYDLGFLERPKAEADTRTSLQKNIEEAGFKRGTAEYQAAIRQQLAKSSGTQVVVNPAQQDLPESVRKNIDAAVERSGAAELESANMLDLSNRIASTKFGPTGVFATAKDFFVDAVGGTDQETQLRKEFLKLRNSEVVKALPPGPATDKDIAIFAEGFEKATAAPERLQSFLRGAAKLRTIESQVNAAKADWLQNNKSLQRSKADFTAGSYDVKSGNSFLDLQKRIVNDINSQYFGAPSQTQQATPAAGAIQAPAISTQGFSLLKSRPAGQ